MGLVSFFQSAERRFGWSFAGFILGLVSLAFAATLYFLGKQEQKTDLRITVEDEVNVVEVREQIPLLKILYDNQDTTESHKEIKIIRLVVQNFGQTILQTFYDMNQGFGLVFDDSQILGARLLGSNSDYLRENLERVWGQSSTDVTNRSSAPARTRLEFGKVIFERGKYARFKILLIQDKGIARTHIVPVGKISGMDSIPVNYAPLGQQPRHYTDQQALMAAGLVYAATIGTLFGVVFGTEWYSTRKRRRTVTKFLKDNPGLTPPQRFIVESYSTGWPRHWASLISGIVDGHDTLDLAEYVKEQAAKLLRRPAARLTGTLAPRLGRLASLPLAPEVFHRDGIRVSLNPENKEFLIRFLTFAGEI